MRDGVQQRAKWAKIEHGCGILRLLGKVVESQLISSFVGTECFPHQSGLASRSESAYIKRLLVLG